MKLSTYMEKFELNDEAFAQKIGKARVDVFRYRRGHNVPPLPVIAKITEVTEGAVTYTDFLITDKDDDT